MAALTPDLYQPLLKQRYPSYKIQHVGYKNNVLLALMPKDESFTGDVFKMPILFGGAAAGSHVFATAQANKSPIQSKAFLLTRVRDYALGSIMNETLLASSSDVGAFMRAVTPTTDTTIKNASHSLNIDLYRNGGGARGRVGSVSTTALTLLEPSDVVHFETGMKITSSNTDGTSGSDDAQALEITAINRDTGVLTTTVTWTAGGNFSDNDYLFREGDFGVACAGLDAWVPASAPDSTSFFGVNRTADSRLGGLRYSGASDGSIEECLLNAENKAHVNSAELDYIVMNTADLGQFTKSLGSRVVYDRASSPDMPKVGFRGVRLVGASGDVMCIGDRDCPKGVAYGLQMNTWKFASLGKAPQFLKAMSLGSELWDYNADSVEFRIGWYGNLGCSDPGANIRITLPSG